MESDPIRDPQYLYGLILATQASVMGAAQQLDRDQFVADVMASLERLRTVVTFSDRASDAMLAAIDATETYWREACAPSRGRETPG